ncbi:DUF427 domain-containing protein [Sphingopyxis sp. SE2]|uniref:DUF427 domain-containing protein n=1 Tax=Sphingopyxis sp. SE2 TaxID=1586240 RepID=UPI0028C24967|nr:DUF427 domain-containing protein [Sphingopyxis sp. SE2]MDT7531190.1 DUF427 domain-containing protein [Sphingopyxis sp. SE2]
MLRRAPAPSISSGKGRNRPSIGRNSRNASAWNSAARRAPTAGGALILFETSLPPRFCLPPEAVRTKFLTRSQKVTQCPYKGEARHWHVEVEGKRVEDAAWTYPAPFGEADPIHDCLSFYPSKVRIEVDGEQLGPE